MSTATAPAEQEKFQVPPGPVVVFNDVSIAFDLKPVLQNISFSVEAGQTLIILGPAGGGKSVLMKLANGLMCPDSGTIEIFGQEITTMSEVDLYALRAHIGMVFQESALFDSLSVEENIAFRLHEQRIPEEESHNRVVEALKFVDLEHAIDKFPSELSGGMRRRVSIARAIITGPDLILYDSPTGGLDPITSTTIVELVVKQRDVSNATSLLITHRLQDAFVLAMNRFNQQTNKMELIPDNGIDASTMFLVLNEGKIVFHGTTEQLVHSEDPWLKNFLS
ncbi:ABC transporter ATP-binding protein [Granulicella arctica]|uniref:ABC transporter ATP-binding protein n=1 Tax=Granulicella arctica TaxID=940613 RepID=UPI0021E00ABB|nr:ATP-binding cassette domain-containing protein [Granulicella arctica]